MLDRHDRPDWVQCARCGTVYSPSLRNTFACPKCGDPGWFPAAIPDGEEPLTPPFEATS
jgi:Zn finger protein HypA/HybF involved in hydrogenase expression